MNRLIIAGIGVLAVALAAGGCGDGGSEEATAQVSKAHFYKQARAICAKTEKEIQTVLAASKDVSAEAGRVARLRMTEAKELDALTGSEAVEQEVEPFIATILKASQVLAQEGRVPPNDPNVKAYIREATALDLRKC